MSHLAASGWQSSALPRKKKKKNPTSLMPDLLGLTNWTNKFIFNPLLVYKGGPRINPVGSKQRHDPKNMIIIKKESWFQI